MADTFQKCAHVVEETFGKNDTIFEQEDKVKCSNRATKEHMKFMAAFDVVESLPTEYDRVREDLEISIAECVHKPTKFYSTWMEEAHKNATTKGHSMIYREKI